MHGRASCSISAVLRAEWGLRNWWQCAQFFFFSFYCMRIIYHLLNSTTAWRLFGFKRGLPSQQGHNRRQAAKRVSVGGKRTRFRQQVYRQSSDRPSRRGAEGAYWKTGGLSQVTDEAARRQSPSQGRDARLHGEEHNLPRWKSLCVNRVLISNGTR